MRGRFVFIKHWMSWVGGIWLRPLTRMTLNDLTSMECFSRGLWIACLLLRPNLWSFFYYGTTLWELGYLPPLTPCAVHGSRVPNPLRCGRHGLHHKWNGLCTSGGGERSVLLEKWTWYYMLSLLCLQLYFESDRKSLRLHGSASGPTSLYAAVTLEPQNAKSPKRWFSNCVTMTKCCFVWLMLSSGAFLRSSNTGVKRTLNHGSPHSVKGCLEQFIQSLLCFSPSVCISWTGAKNAFQTVQVSNPDNVIQTSSRREVLENTWWYLISNPGKNKMNWGQSSEMLWFYLYISLCIFKLWKSSFTVKKKKIPF